MTAQPEPPEGAAPALAHPHEPLRYAEGAHRLHLPAQSTLVAIGNFDGVHLGHKAVLGRAVETARSRGLRPVVLTFHPHPSEVLGRGPLPRLTHLERKVELLQRTSEELYVVVHPFDRDLANLAPERFVEDLLVRPLGASIVQVGTNFRFGKGRAGDLATLAELGARHGFEARSEPLFGDDEGSYSSTRVRQLIADGDMAAAARLLGRPHMLSGVVVQGDQRGRTLGFPTANLSGTLEARPPHGVYAVVVDAEASPGRFAALARGVMNLGVRPTFGAGASSEVHLLDWSGELYGRRLRVHVVERLRGERKFAGVDELKAQIASDVNDARRVLPESLPGAQPWF